MEYTNLAPIFFIISILVFLLAVVLIVPTIIEARRLEKRANKSVKNWHLPFHRLKRKLKKVFSSLFDSNKQRGLLGTLNLL
ncbi:hypothetical protein AB8P51_08240 [Muriicola sp. SD30]|uniref:hypothetical protein n=1 Tax=Muriicola sp. SD30 TaxID=3240936 RepID=UPI00350F7D4E